MHLKGGKWKACIRLSQRLGTKASDEVYEGQEAGVKAP